MTITPLDIVNKTVVSIHQPQYWPWLGLIDKILKSDIHIILDDVQFNARGFQHRTFYKPNNATSARYLTIPYDKKLKRNIISEVIINNELLINDKIWQKEHLRLITEGYKGAPFFKEIHKEIEPIFFKSYNILSEVNIDILRLLLKLFEINVQLVCSSELNSNEKKDRLMLDLTKKVGGTVYLSGRGAKVYMNDNIFKENHIELIYQDFQHPNYTQFNGEFVPGLFSLDLLYNEGIKASRAIIRDNLKNEHDEVVL